MSWNFGGRAHIATNFGEDGEHEGAMTMWSRRLRWGVGLVVASAPVLLPGAPAPATPSDNSP
jgi:hypothetical protein